MPQVARDKRCFPLNKETVKNTFVAQQVCVHVCVWVGGWGGALACARQRARQQRLDTEAALLKTVMTSQGQRDYHCLHSNPL